MSRRLTLEARAGFGDALFAAAQSALDAVRRFLARRRRARLAAVFRSELRALDDHVLHDIGIDRSEIGSVASEMAGLEDPTRLRALVSSNVFP